ncbi:MAG: hypothetical protein KDB65_12740 [Calditrichaeota bacterium]|nr:hypothetical protein [Calditrichota bacterium]
MRGSRLILLSSCLALLGCAATSPAVRFEKLRAVDSRPVAFNDIGNESSQVNAKIGLKVPGLRGSASGILRHAKEGQYLIELYGRNELFLKVYFTRQQTILWPAVGAPSFFAPDSTPTLRECVHSLLPDWRLDDVLPIPLVPDDNQLNVEWRANSKEQPSERLSRTDQETIYKTFKSASGNAAFPYFKVVLQGEKGDSRLTWTLKPISRPKK